MTCLYTILKISRFDCPLLAESSHIIAAEAYCVAAAASILSCIIMKISEEYLMVRGNISRGVFLEAIYIGLYTIHPKISRFDPLLAESSILYAERIAWPPPRDSTSCGNIEEYLIVRGNISRGSLSRSHIYRPIHYTPKNQSFRPASCRKFYIIC